MTSRLAWKTSLVWRKKNTRLKLCYNRQELKNVLYNMATNKVSNNWKHNYYIAPKMEKKVKLSVAAIVHEPKYGGIDLQIH